MSAASDKLREMVDAYPETVSRLTANIATVTDQRDDLQEQKDAIIDGVLTGLKTDLENHLNTKGYDMVHYDSDYGCTDSSSCDLEGWRAAAYMTDGSTINYIIATNEFEIDNDHTTDLAVGTRILVDCGVDGIKYSVVDTSAFAGGVTTVTLTLGSESITANAQNVGIVAYEYEGTGWDADTTIIDYVTDFAFGIDHIYKSLGTNGTYGLDEMIILKDDAITLLTANRDKYSDAITIYEDYATPT